MKRVVASLATLVLLALGGSAFGQVTPPHSCTIDAVPAATLLLPYFEVDYTTANSQKAIDTFFTINNASSAPMLAHVTLWTNISLPTLDFDVYLTGYDVEVVSLRSLFKDGVLPQTATPVQDTSTNSISPGPANLDPAVAPTYAAPIGLPLNYTSCNGFFPIGTLPADLVARIQNGHTGQPVVGNSCLGLDVGKTTTVDGTTVPLAIGYITVDNVNSCSILFPGDTGYFVNGGQGVANNINALWGDYFIVDPANNAAFGDNLVAIEASPANMNATGTNFSFYSRFLGTTAADNREPLANGWATRYISGGAFDGGTRLAVWRDSRVNTSGTNFVTCGNAPFAPLEEGQVVAFDQQENCVILCEEVGNVSPPIPDVQCFPWEINWVSVGTGNLNPPWNNGWLYLNLDIADEGTGTNFLTQGSQAWVTPVFTALGRYEVGYAGNQLWSACRGFAPGINTTCPLNTN